MISTLLPKLHLRSKSDQFNSCLLVFLWLLCKQRTHIDAYLDPWADFAAWPWISLITMDLPDGHRVTRPTLFTTTGPKPDHDSLTCTPSYNPGPPLTAQTHPMTWSRAWTPSRHSRIPLGYPSGYHSWPTLLTPFSSCGTAWWPAYYHPQVPPLEICWPSLLRDREISYSRVHCYIWTLLPNIPFRYILLEYFFTPSQTGWD